MIIKVKQKNKVISGFEITDEKSYFDDYRVYLVVNNGLNVTHEILFNFSFNRMRNKLKAYDFILPRDVFDDFVSEHGDKILTHIVKSFLTQPIKKRKDRLNWFKQDLTRLLQHWQIYRFLSNSRDSIFLRKSHAWKFLSLTETSNPLSNLVVEIRDLS